MQQVGFPEFVLLATVAALLLWGNKIPVAVQQLHVLVHDNVETGSALFSDALKSCDGLGDKFVHQVIDHAEAYIDGQVHTNGLENLCSLLKRGINGTYVSVEPYHLLRNVDEQAYRFNHRKETDPERFVGALSQIVGRRLTWNQLMAAFPGGDGQCQTAFRPRAKRQKSFSILCVIFLESPRLTWTQN